MKILIAMDSYKNCCTSLEAAEAVEKGLLRADKDVEIVKLAVADGGEGTTEAVLSALGGEKVYLNVKDPLGREIKGYYGITERGEAVIEIAAASGLPLLQKHEINPLQATTYGTGQLIKDALERGCRKIYLGLGGSATNDGGAGMMQALGVKFLKDDGTEIGFGGGQLNKIADIDFTGLDSGLKDCKIVILSDVTNKLCGSEGASAVFGPQKGASREMVKLLDDNLKHFAEIIEKKTGKKVAELQGAGAAGGTPAGLMAFCCAEIYSGGGAILDLIEIEKHLINTDLVITGEGQTDFQTAFGKIPVKIAERARKYGIPVVAISGSIGKGAEAVYEKDIDAVISIMNRPMELSEALERGPQLIEEAAENVMRLWNCAREDRKRR